MVYEEDILNFARELEGVSEQLMAPEKEYGREKILFLRGEKVFLVIEKGTRPLNIEVRCDRKLAKTLEERYESALEGAFLGRNGLKLICSGQLEKDEVLDLVRLAFELSIEE